MPNFTETDIDAGNILSSIDAGNSIKNNYNNFTVNLNYLYNTGNCYYDLLTGYLDADVLVLTGQSYPFYQVQTNFRNTNTNGLSHSLLNYSPSNTGVLSYLKVSGIFYSTTSNDFYVSATNENGVTKNTQTVTPSIESVNVKTYDLQNFDPTKHLLIVYNQSSQESIDIKNYYLSVRTGLSNANVLGVSTTSSLSGDVTSITEYQNNVRTPIINWINSNLDKPIRYITLMYDIGIRFSGLANQNLISGNPNIRVTGTTGLNNAKTSERVRFSVVQDLTDYLHYTSQNRSNLETNASYYFFNGIMNITTPTNYLENYSVAKFSQTPVLVSHITARNKYDVSGYIEKITQKGIVSGFYIRSSGQNDTFLANLNIQDGEGTNTAIYNYPSGTIKFCPEARTVITREKSGGYPIETGGNLAGFTFHGIHYGDGLQRVMSSNYSTNGQVVFTGYNWYIMSTRESYNGVNLAYNGNVGLWGDENDGNQLFDLHGTIFSWLKSGAFSGAKYENCPVGAVGHCQEPGDMANGYAYWIMWQSGHPFIECAYRSRDTIYGAASWTCIGDPLLMK